MLLSDLRPLIRIQVPGCPDPVIDMVAVESTRQLCRSTNVWRYTLESADLSKEGKSVVMSPPEDTEILTVFAVEYGDVGVLTPRTAAQLSRAVPTWREDSGDPTSYVYTLPYTLRLVPWPTTLSMSDLTVTVSLMPTVGVTSIDDRLAVPYSEVIRTATIGQLMLMPNKPWSNPRNGAAYLQGVASTIDSIIEDGTDGGVRNLPRSVRYGGY
jgi:hypothetical protein